MTQPDRLHETQRLHEEGQRLHEEGLSLLEAGRLDEALDRIGRALDLASMRPLQQTALVVLKTAQLHNSFGAVLVELGHAEAAAASFRIALVLAPGFAPAWTNLGSAAVSASAHGRAIALAPFAADAHANLGALEQRRGRSEAALRRYAAAVALAPADPRVWSNLGSARYWAGRLDLAGRAFERALALAPGFADGRFHRGLLRLLLGDYVGGFADYEERRKRRSGIVRLRRAIPGWAGEDPAGKRLLVWGEQGLGDTIHFARFVPLLTARGAEVTLAAPRRLVSLLRTLGGVERVQSFEEPLPAVDLQAPLMSLPHLLGLGAAAAAPLAPYLASPPASAAFVTDGRPLVGLAWAGSPTNESDAWRSLALERLSPLLALKGLRFVSLQVGPRAADVAAAGLEGRLETREDLGDFADTAAVVAGLDLVVTVDTALAHLAGAMGKEAWVMLSHVPDWRWGMKGETTPWYPSLRLFRQESPGDWDGVVRRIARALAARFPGVAGR